MSDRKAQKANHIVETDEPVLLQASQAGLGHANDSAISANEYFLARESEEAARQPEKSGQGDVRLRPDAGGAIAAPTYQKSNYVSGAVETEQTEVVPAPLVFAQFRVLNIKAVCELTSLSRAQVYRLHDVGGFPRPVKLTNSRIGWMEREIIAWIEARIAERDEEVQA